MNIKELRKITGLSQKKFSEKFKIPVRTIQNWESGTNPTPIYTERLIEMQLILENEIEALRDGQLQLNFSEPEEQPKPEPERHKILTYMKASLMDIEIEDIYCDNCIYGKECNFNYKDCKYHKENQRECECIENWIYWKDLERMIEE